MSGRRNTFSSFDDVMCWLFQLYFLPFVVYTIFSDVFEDYKRRKTYGLR